MLKIAAGSECAALAPLLAEHAGGRLLGAEARQVAHHLGACAACRATTATLARVQRVGAAEDAPDLWPRLAARLLETQVRVPLRLPRLSWEVAAALATVVVGPLLIAEPGRLLALMLGML